MKSNTAKQVIGWVAAIAVLLAVFSLYSHPHLMLKLDNHIWACF